VIDKGVLLLLFDPLFLGFNLLLLLDLVHVIFSLNSGLLSKRRLLLGELGLSCDLEISQDSLLFLVLESLPLSSLSLTLLESSLGS